MHVFFLLYNFTKEDPGPGPETLSFTSDDCNSILQRIENNTGKASREIIIIDVQFIKDILGTFDLHIITCIVINMPFSTRTV